MDMCGIIWEKEMQVPPGLASARRHSPAVGTIQRY